MQKSFLNELAEKRQQATDLNQRANAALLGLCQSESYKYIRGIASEIQAEFRCKPTDPNWTTFTTIGYAFEQLFSKMEQKARTAQQSEAPKSILAEIQQNARHSRS